LDFLPPTTFVLMHIKNFCARTFEYFKMNSNEFKLLGGSHGADRWMGVSLLAMSPAVTALPILGDFFSQLLSKDTFFRGSGDQIRQMDQGGRRASRCIFSGAPMRV